MLTAGQIGDYDRDGFLVLPDLVPSRSAGP